TGLAHLVILAPALWVGAQWGAAPAVGIALGALVPRIVSSVVAFALILRYLQIRVDELFAPLIRSACAASLMFVAVWAFRSYVALPGNYSGAVTLSVSVGIGVVSYAAATALCNRPLLVEFFGTMRSVLVAKG
ncbi:MAG: polysaccharide biosynthesis C-terminal domain-containing protein, partial [Planctomycetota bacterium]